MLSKTWICTGKLQNFGVPHLLNRVQTTYKESVNTPKANMWFYFHELLVAVHRC